MFFDGLNEEDSKRIPQMLQLRTDGEGNLRPLMPEEIFVFCSKFVRDATRIYLFLLSQKNIAPLIAVAIAAGSSSEEGITSSLALESLIVEQDPRSANRDEWRRCRGGNMCPSWDRMEVLRKESLLMVSQGAD
jgi:hypothetical protein